MLFSFYSNYLYIGTSNIVHQFVTSEKDKQQFVDELGGKVVFMKDGKTEQQIISVHECIDTDERFKNKAAQEIEKVTPF